MRGNVVGFVAFDFVLRLRRAGVVRVALVRKISGVDLADGARHPAGFGIPPYVVAHAKFWFYGHAFLYVSASKSKYSSSSFLPPNPLPTCSWLSTNSTRQTHFTIL